jgi:N-acetylmuramoyl-L-alanine amidase
VLRVYLNMRFLILFILIASGLNGQSVLECKKRFDDYLNFKGTLNNLVRFDKDGIYIYNSKGQKEFSAYQKEIPMLAEVFENYDAAKAIKFYKNKGNKKLGKQERDSIRIYLDLPKKKTDKDELLPLKGIKVALDAGHIAGSFSEAMNEQKFLYFLRDSLKDPLDTVKIYEAELTFKTALILKKMLEEKGAIVFLTRPTQSLTSFGCTYSYWYATYKQKVLDSLLKMNKLEAAEYRKLKTLPEYNFFWDFFRDYELANRARMINQFKPDATCVIHYNVDEKNVPWKKTSTYNYTMAFIGGCFTPDRLDMSESKINFLRLLFGTQLNNSEKLSGLTVKEFSESLGIPAAASNDADYLKNNCMSTKHKGVYCRQLILCNKICSPLVYGESLYQDNVEESAALMKNTVNMYDVRTNERVVKVARSYFNAILYYFTK